MQTPVSPLQSDFGEVAAQQLEHIAARAQEIEQLRKLPQDLVERLADLGLYNLCNPPAFGGHAQSPRVYAEVVETLATADASVAWCCFIGITSSFSMASSNSPVVREILQRPGTIAAGVFAPTGRSRRAEQDGQTGFRVYGRWSWGSGSQNAGWVSVGTLLEDDQGEIVRDDEGKPVYLACILDARDITFADNWRVMGLQGTGSTDFEVEGVFVPGDRSYSQAGSRLGTPPDDPIFLFPNFGMLGIGIAATALGTARAAIDDVVALARSKTPQGASKTLVQKPATAVDVARAESHLRAGRTFFYESIDTAWQGALDGNVTTTHRRDLRLAITHAVHEAKRAIDLAHELAGGTSVYSRSPIQRRFRDVHVMTQHMMVNQATYELVGRLFLGLPTNTDQL
ncbi:MAG: acyl-CoA dehydrogenase family protein [Sinimarinibacterium flocculans]|uniref:acyl-CoA dehydrogenase family protein n=1 Tax=Sinimarinibacterium flocculans TaxID=985250 RepID=UPI003C689F8C